MAKEEKTNVMRVLTQKKVEYVGHTYEQDASLTGAEIAAKMGENPDAVFKTLVTQGKSKNYYVFVIPVEKELDLKKAAKAVGEKSIEMLPLKELLPLTGYVHGGCSPIGMKKFFTTTFDESLNKLDKVYFSGGKVGFQVEVAVKDISKVIRYGTADVTV
ncbi:MAG: Cys-tRNA(Pro) deacylase [Lachnospiraceae bacterium]|nr:Cys-tRNA(Pro) deacylase [Lachnospiraceae bacterium]